MIEPICWGRPDSLSKIGKLGQESLPTHESINPYHYGDAAPAASFRIDRG